MFHMCVQLDTLQTAESRYIPLPTTCRLVGATSALYLTLTTGDSAITFTDGTTTIGTITITQSGCAEADLDNIVIADATVELAKSGYLVITNDATPGQGAAMITMTFDEYHGEI